MSSAAPRILQIPDLKPAKASAASLQQMEVPSKELHNDDAEEAVLSALLLEGGHAMDQIAHIFLPVCFYSTANQLVAQAIQEIYLDDGEIDLITVSDRMSSQKYGDVPESPKTKLEVAGGRPYLVQLSGAVASSANIEYHTYIVYQKYLERCLAAVARNIASRLQGYAGNSDALAVLEDMEHQVARIHQLMEHISPKSFTSVVERQFDTHKKRGTEDAAPALYYPHPSMRVLGGIGAGDTVLVSALSEVGKTAFAMDMAYEWLLKGHKVGYIDLEVGSSGITNRLYARTVPEESGITNRMLQDESRGSWELEQLQDIYMAKEFIKKLPLQLRSVSEDGRLSEIDYLCDLIESQLIRAHGCEVVIVDNLNIIRIPKLKNTEVVPEAAYRMNQIRAKTKVPFVLLTQFRQSAFNNRKQVEARPTRDDLFGGASTANYASTAIGLWRPDKHEMVAEEAYPYGDIKGQVRATVMKGRNLPDNKDVFEFKLRFNGDRQLFTDWRKTHEPDLSQPPAMQFKPGDADFDLSHATGQLKPPMGDDDDTAAEGGFNAPF